MKIKKKLVLVCAAATIGFATTSCSDDDKVTPLSVVTFEDANLNTQGILREGTLIDRDDNDLGNFWAAYTEKGITVRNFVQTEYYDYWCGFEISNQNDMTTTGYANESSVYNAKAHSGSKFALCYDGGSTMGPGYENEIYVADNTNKVFDHIYVANATYAALSMLNGDGFAKKMNYADQDYFKLTITGIDNTGTVKGTKEFCLADFRTANSGGVVTEWTKVDLTSLGAVQKLQFTLSSSDNSGGYINTPTYFCLDDIAIKE